MTNTRGNADAKKRVSDIQLKERLHSIVLPEENIFKLPVSKCEESNKSEKSMVSTQLSEPTITAPHAKKPPKVKKKLIKSTYRRKKRDKHVSFILPTDEPKSPCTRSQTLVLSDVSGPVPRTKCAKTTVESGKSEVSTSGHIDVAPITSEFLDIVPCTSASIPTSKSSKSSKIQRIGGTSKPNSKGQKRKAEKHKMGGNAKKKKVVTNEVLHKGQTIFPTHKVVAKGRVKTLNLYKSLIKDDANATKKDKFDSVMVDQRNSGRRCFPSIATRMSPKGFSYVIQCLESYQQFQDITDLGFGGLYWLDVHRLPLRLSFWLIDNFDPYNNTISLFNGEKLSLTAKDVHNTLGLPMGSKIVELASSTGDSDEFRTFFQNWRGQFGITNGLVPIKTLVYYIVHQVEGGYWFKVNFVVLVVSLLLRNNQKSFSNFHILKCLMDVDDIPNYNWCEFVMDSLRFSKKQWHNDKRMFFSGPLLFLVLFYVDRVVIGSRSVERNYFTLCGWTTSLLSKREEEEMKSGAFGRGFIDLEMEESMDASNIIVQGSKGSCSFTKSTDRRCQTDLKGYVLEHSSCTKTALEGMISLEHILRRTTSVVCENPTVKKLRDIGLRLVVEAFETQPVYSSSFCKESGKTEEDCNKIVEKGVDMDHQSSEGAFKHDDANQETNEAEVVATELSNIPVITEEYHSVDEMVNHPIVVEALSLANSAGLKKASPILCQLKKSPTSYASPKEYIDDYALSARRMVDDMVVLDDKVLEGESNFPDDEIVKKLHSSTTLLYRTYGGCDSSHEAYKDADVSFSPPREVKEMSFDSPETVSAVIALAEAVETAYNKKKQDEYQKEHALVRRAMESPSFGPMSFSLGVSQEDRVKLSQEDGEKVSEEDGEKVPKKSEIDPDTIVTNVISEILSAGENNPPHNLFHNL